MGQATDMPTANEFEGPELIVVADPAAGLEATPSGLEAASADVGPIKEALADARLVPLFGTREDRLRAEATEIAAAADEQPPDLSVYYKVEAPAENLEAIAAALRETEGVQAAYVKPAAEPPQLNTMAPTTAEPPSRTPDFTSRQEYLGSAPAGIDARFAVTWPGGDGAGVSIIDVEGAWRFSHEDLAANQGGVVGGTESPDIGWRNHGTAVIGEFSGDGNGFGITGICPQANVRAISIFPTSSNGSARAIRQAANSLNAGDILLIELHRPGPRHNFQLRNDQAGYIAVEYWPDDFDAILFATLRGVVVVEAAGNGGENLDDAIYDSRPAGFPASWTNPFNRSNRDSGAIIVGAGAPPPNTHGADHGPDRSRLGFSNYGASVDAQGWGREVTTTGYGDLQGGSNEDEWYTDRFSGTSSASPIVVGALACVQGVRRARGLTPYTAAQARERLQATGSLQTDAPGRPATQRIGNRPDLRQLIGVAREPLVKRGAKGDSVRALQQALIRAGLDPGPFDGIFGKRVSAAVTSFQKTKGLKVDGIVGPQTWGALDGA